MSATTGRVLRMSPHVRRAIRTHLLPYGRCTWPGGSEVLFNRWMQPIWRRQPGGAAKPANPRNTRPGARGHVRFYRDDMDEAAIVAAGEAALREWGLPMPSAADLGTWAFR